MRRSLILAAFLAGGVTLFAAERATFIMNDGERITGVISTRPGGYGGNGNLTRGNFVVTVNNRDVRLPADAVAVIDFAGGNPSARELDRLPSGNRQLLVLRDGSAFTGRLLDLLRGDTVRWQHDRAGSEDIPIRRIERIYLNPDASRQVLADNNSYRGPRSGSTYGSGYDNSRYGSPAYGSNEGRRNEGYASPSSNRSGNGVLTSPNGIAVPANADWVDTGIDVRAGDMLSFSGSGQIHFGTGAGQTASVDGNPDLKRNTYPVPAMSVGGLIGKVGNSQAFPIGGNTNAIRMPANGRLFLSVNDDQRGDNSGAFTVVIRRGQ
jgi:PA-IL-like protein